MFDVFIQKGFNKESLKSNTQSNSDENNRSINYGAEQLTPLPSGRLLKLTLEGKTNPWFMEFGVVSPSFKGAIAINNVQMKNCELPKSDNHVSRVSFNAKIKVCIDPDLKCDLARW